MGTSYPVSCGGCRSYDGIDYAMCHPSTHTTMISANMFHRLLTGQNVVFCPVMRY
jgi:hypothetical protein